MMNGRHAGQGMPPDGGRRGRPYTQHPNPYSHQMPGQHGGPQMYNYMQPYGAANYYPQAPPPHWFNAQAHMQQQQMQYNPPGYPNVRSPPMQHYPPGPHPAQHQPSYSRQQPATPPVAPYQPPTPQVLSSTPSIHSTYVPPVPATPPTPALAVSVPPKVIQPEVIPAVEAVEERPEEFTQVSMISAPHKPLVYVPFRAPLPWYSDPDLPFPTRRARRKRKVVQTLSAELVKLPEISQAPNAEVHKEAEHQPSDELEIDTAEKVSIIRPETPSISLPTSENNDSTNPTTPSSLQQQYPSNDGDITPVAPKVVSRQSAPVVPVVPALPKVLPRESPKVAAEKTEAVNPVKQQAQDGNTVHEIKAASEAGGAEEVKEPIAAPVPAWTKPKLWAGLFTPNAAVNGASNDSAQALLAPNGVKPTSESLADALRSFNAVSTDAKVSFLQPRGLVNTGNMCYMNSVLQVLVFCGPFYNFLDQVSKRAAHSFKSETPLLDAMIIFMREFKVIDSAASVEKLRMRLKEGELEQYGDSFTPDFVYNVINRLPRFSSMRQGHQQDAEEFLGFLLDGLHEECVHVMRTSASTNGSAMATPINGPSSPVSEVNSVSGFSNGQDNGWLEVGPKQKSAITRSSGTITTGSPLTKIFGGNLRSELRVPGVKDSVTLEPYQPLQLDIGAPNVNNILDALKGLTRSETLNGDFKTIRGQSAVATKQVFIETLPPVLILHLKRFQYDNAGGTQKIWKKVGYPLELEMPKEVFSRQKRSVYAHSGLPKYRLIGVVYHHGKNASGGHYTVDVRRQEGREWVRLDDTVIRRVRSEEVAEGGSEEDPKVIAAVLEAHSKDNSISLNGFAAIDGVEEENGDEGWKKASGPGKKWSAVANGASTPKAKSDKFSVKDNKVAYLLFYQKI